MYWIMQAVIHLRSNMRVIMAGSCLDMLSSLPVLPSDRSYEPCMYTYVGTKTHPHCVLHLPSVHTDI